MVHCVECGPMPNLMAALPSVGGPLRKFRNFIPCTTQQSLADAHCSSAVQYRCQRRRTQNLDAK